MKSFMVFALVAYCFVIIAFGAWDNIVYREENHVMVISERLNVPNTVTAVYLQSRVYDTLFEIILFTMVAMAVAFMLKSEPVHEHNNQTIDNSTSVYGSLVGVLSLTAFCFVVLNGHLSPGGGFAGGVILASGISLYAITSGFSVVNRQYERMKAGMMEGASFLIIVSFMTLAAVFPEVFQQLNQKQSFGALFSGGIIPMLNILIGVKVYAASWKMVKEFVARRGPL